jgi:16S rRNA (guanine966-N2)-methyltransferase
VREALFAMLEARGRVVGARVLDLYAGTGALGLEAISRGALQATFVERGREALEALRHNVAALGLADRAHVVRGSVETSSSRLRGPFDLVLVDPPYVDVTSGGVARALARVRPALAPDAVLVLEHASTDTAPEVEGFARGVSRRHGDTTLTFYEVAQAR